MMQCVINCNRKDCEFNYQGNTCSYGGECLRITNKGCETFESRELETELTEDISEFCAKMFPNYHSMMTEFQQGMLADVIECSDFEHGSWSESDIHLAFEREVASRFGIEI